MSSVLVLALACVTPVTAQQPTLAYRKDRLPGVVTKAAAICVFRIEDYIDAFLLIVLHHVGLHSYPVGGRQQQYAE